MKKHFVYIAACADGTLYTGYTVDLKKREAEHNAGRASRYTRARLPVKFVYTKKCSSKSAALRHEYRIKQFSRAQKEKLFSTI